MHPVQCHGVQWSGGAWSAVQGNGVQLSGVQWSAVEGSKCKIPMQRRAVECTERHGENALPWRALECS